MRGYFPRSTDTSRVSIVGLAAHVRSAVDSQCLAADVAPGLASAEIRGADVEVEAGVPPLGRQIAQRAHAGAAGVVDENVDPPQLVDGAPHHVDDLLFVLDVGADRDAPPPGRALDLFR